MTVIKKAAAAAAALSLLAACSPGRSAISAVAPTAAAADAPSAATGPSRPMGDGSVWTYVLSDTGGRPVEVGVRLTGAALRGLPGDMPAGHPVPVVLNFPDGAATGVLNHVEFYWNPMGHEPPGVWDKPHFDYHFFTADEATAKSVDPTRPDFAAEAANVPDAKYMPADYGPPPGTALSNTIPLMGLHWMDKTVTRTPGRYDFTQELIRGSYDGNVVFIEPMITRDWLLTHSPVEQQLKEPAAYQRAGRYPTTYTVRYDPERDEYSVALGGFTQRDAS